MRGAPGICQLQKIAYTDCGEGCKAYPQSVFFRVSGDTSIWEGGARNFIRLSAWTSDGEQNPGRMHYV
jgi:hypothetical protein